MHAPTLSADPPCPADLPLPLPQLFTESQKREYYLLLELRHAQGWDSLGPTSPHEFYPPSSTRTQAQNRESRRQVQYPPRHTHVHSTTHQEALPPAWDKGNGVGWDRMGWGVM